MTLRPLLEIALDDGPFRALASAAREAEGGAVRAHASASMAPYLLAALADSDIGFGDRPLLVVAADDRAARDMAAAMRAYLAPRPVLFYPSRGTTYESHIAPPPHLVGLRLAALGALLGGRRGEDRGDSGQGQSLILASEASRPGTGSPDPPCPVVVASAIALAEAVPDPELWPVGLSVERGEEVSLDELAGRLVEAGYERVDQVEERAQFAIRGGILDVFPATEDRAARIELFGDEVESLRWFSTFTQRSLGEAERVELAAAAELAAEHRILADLVAGDSDDEPRPDVADVLPVERFRAVMDLVPEPVAVAIAAEEEIEPALADHWQDVTTAMHAADARHLYVDAAAPLGARSRLALSTVLSDQPHSFAAQPATSPARTLREAESELEKLVRAGSLAVVAFERRGEAERARYGLGRVEAGMLGDVLLDREPGVLFAEAGLREGFVSEGLALAVIPYRRLVHRRPAPAAPARARLAAFTELRVGDHVVHEDHGVARFAGFETRAVAGVTRDYLQLEYRGDDRVFVPTDQLAKISRYVGAGGEAPVLSALGGKRWQNVRARARRAAGELAGELLNLYAERRTRPGHAFAPRGELQLAFEGAFPFIETADQIDAIEAVTADMEAPRPMDRLICGDVGYGKTEVALRAAHKAVADGKQVMMLVPTTILAQQHFGTFKERFRDSPFICEVVSRLRKPADVREAVRAFSEGRVDILIGTHRLLSRDVRARDLGLLIVDEEQRFGVRQKELLRQLRLKVDVLSLSATPIPRTLQMSLAGLRDISVIETPPEGRHPVRTHVGAYDDAVVKRAVEREVARGGQIFFLHNRIDTLPEAAEALRGLCPGARIVEAHGRMPEEELETTMLSFLRGDADCLVATTIIESGLDVPSANTLIVERADELGLAQAYQIRGRVGRSRERAFAYLFFPAAESLSPEAAARLATLSDHTELGSGFRIAMRDLDIRGAGDLLGDEQSGHVAAVGFELYCQMLDEATEELAAGDGRGLRESAVRLDADLDAYIPSDYIAYEAAKIEVHRRVAATRDTAALGALAAELADRFGPPPETLETLLALQRARIGLARAGIESCELRDERLTLAPVEAGDGRLEAVRGRHPDAAYDPRKRSLRIDVPADSQAKLAALVAIADILPDS